MGAHWSEVEQSCDHTPSSMPLVDTVTVWYKSLSQMSRQDAIDVQVERGR
jgi:hypothetical protein